MAKGRKINPAMRVAADAAFDKQGNPKPGTTTAFMRALDVQRPLVLANLDRLRRKYPDATPAELAAKLEKHYLTTVSSGGAAVGATAVVPGITARPHWAFRRWRLSASWNPLRSSPSPSPNCTALTPKTLSARRLW